MSSRWGPMSSPDKHTEHRAGFVNIIGNPNVGKSTLMNALVGEKLSIVTAKAQTTRHRIMGIVNTDDCQIVYSDTPGMLKPNYRLQEDMMRFVDAAIGDADIILYVTDVVESRGSSLFLSELPHTLQLHTHHQRKCPNRQKRYRSSQPKALRL